MECLFLILPLILKKIYPFNGCAYQNKCDQTRARAGPSIVWIDIDGDHEAWKIHTVHAARVRFRHMSALFVCGIRSTNTTYHRCNIL